MAKHGAVTIGGTRPSKRSPLSGSSAETIGALSCTSRRMCVATRRMMRSASAGSTRSPVSMRPMPTLSSHSRPSGLSMTSMTRGSASAAAMAGPKAVRSICRRRPWACWAAKEKRSAMAVPAWLGRTGLALVSGSFQGGIIRCGGEQIRIVGGDALQHLGDEAMIGAEPASDLRDEYLEALPAERTRSVLLGLRERRRDGQEIAHEQRQRLGGDSHIARHDTDAAGEPVKPPQHGIVEQPVALGIEIAAERLLHQRRLGA